MLHQKVSEEYLNFEIAFLENTKQTLKYQELRKVKRKNHSKHLRLDVVIYGLLGSQQKETTVRNFNLTINGNTFC